MFYIHVPCRGTPVKTSCRESIRCTKPAIGLSNFNADEVEEVIRVARENNFVIPSAYQGNYNAISRRTETELMPVLRKWNVALRSMHTAQFQVDFWPKPPNNSWTYTAKMYNALYNKPCMLKALAAFVQLSKDTGISQAELAYRWVAHNSQLQPELEDGIIIGARFGPQLEEAINGVKKGRLSAEVADRIISRASYPTI